MYIKVLDSRKSNALKRYENFFRRKRVRLLNRVLRSEYYAIKANSIPWHYVAQTAFKLFPKKSSYHRNVLGYLFYETFML